METINDILIKYRQEALSEREKGARFEKLVRAFLVSASVYSEIEKAWLWDDAPMRKEMGPDTGIDIVARTHDGEYWAVQCKFYNEGAHIDQGDVQGFLASLGGTFHADGKKTGFAFGLWIDTTSRPWTDNALNKFKNHVPQASRINLGDLHAAGVDWAKLDAGETGTKVRMKPYDPKDHQRIAIGKAKEKYREHDRGRLIMACGTGKTFTALRIAEDQVLSYGGTVLVLVPSIALVGQLMWEWESQALSAFFPICVCSDPTASQKKKKDYGEDTIDDEIVDMPLPATSDPARIAKLHEKRHGAKVIFSTYQSLDKIHLAQINHKLPDIGMIVCDEAHKTIGYKLPGEEVSGFQNVHSDTYIRAKKRLYMTATPRMYRPVDKERLKEKDALLWSMDDEEMYGPMIHELKFGEAVENGLLSDYKVLTLTVSEDDVPESTRQKFRRYRDDYKGKAKIGDDWDAKIIGCVNALSKQLFGEGSETVLEQDPGPMKRAVAFAGRIADSEVYCKLFQELTENYISELPDDQRDAMVGIEVTHIDGGMGASTRQQMVQDLRNGPNDPKNCRILSNVRCLSEGVDVPALDAVLYLAPKKSIVDVVQSVGRVMRHASGKKYGYIIIPIFVSKDTDPKIVLDKSDDYKALWQVLQALRSHDDRFSDTINKIELNIIRPNNIVVAKPCGPGKRKSKYGGNVGDGNQPEGRDGVQTPIQPSLLDMEYEKFAAFQRVIFARIVQKVGSRRAWEDWAKDVADIAKCLSQLIDKAVEGGNVHATKAFKVFLKEMQDTIDTTITKEGAIEMLAQHIITAPVFEALFENYQFAKYNAVSMAMESVLDVLRHGGGLDMQELEKMAPFYDAVKTRAKGIDNPAGRQKVIIELYNNFFKAAFPRLSDMLGIVYTPVEIVDFIIHSVDDVLKAEFNVGLASPSINILDPFSGTGTFITRLIESGLVPKNDLERKYLGDKYAITDGEREVYRGEFFANELVLLAYYISCVNIENAFHFAMDYVTYEPFKGMALTDTFRSWETAEKHTEDAETLIQPETPFDVNTARIAAQAVTPITVVLGNPPYSKGQENANDNAQNYNYPLLDKRIADTYAALTNAKNINRLYDSYIRAFRYATDRLHDKDGIICFVSCGGWLDTNSFTGFRKTIEKEFATIYVFNLRDDIRKRDKKEGGNVFGNSAQVSIAITLLVKRTGFHGKAEILYRDIGDDLSTEKKLAEISRLGSFVSQEMELAHRIPNEHGDWITTRDKSFETYLPLEPDKKFNEETHSVFVVNSIGINSSRDAWVYNFSKNAVLENTRSMIEFYNSQIGLDKQIFDKKKIAWSSSLEDRWRKGKKIQFQKDRVAVSLYKPFTKQWLYLGEKMIHRTGQWDQFFPTHDIQNLVICIRGKGRSQDFSCLISNRITDLNCLEAGAQCFPLHWYKKISANDLLLATMRTEDRGQRTEDRGQRTAMYAEMASATMH